MAVTQKAKIKIRRGPSTQQIPRLDVGEFGLVTDTRELYIGTDVGNLEISTQAAASITNFTVANDNTATLTFLEKMRQVLNAGDLGMTQETSDSQNSAMMGYAMQVASEYNGGRVLYIQPGEYILRGNLTVPLGVSIKGSGRGTTILRNNGGTTLTLSGNNCISDMTIVSTGAVSTVLLAGSNIHLDVDLEGDGTNNSVGCSNNSANTTQIDNFRFNGTVKKVSTGFKFDYGLTNSSITGILLEENDVSTVPYSVKIGTGKQLNNCNIHLTGYAILSYDTGTGNDISVKFKATENTSYSIFPDSGRYEYFSPTAADSISGMFTAKKNEWNYIQYWKSWTAQTAYPLSITQNTTWLSTKPLTIKFTT